MVRPDRGFLICGRPPRGASDNGTVNTIHDVKTHIDKWSEDCRKQLSQNVFAVARGSRDIQLTESYRLTSPITACILSPVLISKGEKGSIPFSCYNKSCVVPKVLSPTDWTRQNPFTSSWSLTQWPSWQKMAGKMMLCGSEKVKWDQEKFSCNGGRNWEVGTHLRVVELQWSFRFCRVLVLLNVEDGVLEINSRSLGWAKHEPNHSAAVEACQASSEWRNWSSKIDRIGWAYLGYVGTVVQA